MARNYLEERLNDTRNKRPSDEIKFLRKVSWEDHQEILAKCMEYLRVVFRQDKPVMLTSTLDSMGRYVCRKWFKEDPLTKKQRILYAAYYFEHLMNGEDRVYIKPQSKAWDAPYEVYPAEGFSKGVKDYPLLYTETSPIPPTKHIMRRRGTDDEFPLIKRWGNKDQAKFYDLLDAPFVKAADTLQSTGWQINSRVLEILQSTHMDKLITPEHKLKDPRTLKGDAQKDMQALISKRDSNIAVLAKASKLDGETFYQYVDFDWRGRVYYKESFFNFQGNDLARGLLRFSEAKPLGQSGLFWLAVHTANSFNQSYSIDEIPEWCEGNYRENLESQGLTDISVDKMTLEDRAAWTTHNMDTILTTGYLGGLPDCEKPVAFLACCLEYVAMDGMVNPEWHFCTLPIPVDGSNNGWQHLGAMLKDELTGSLVGLVPSDIPNDLYVRVAKEIVECYPEFFEERGMRMKQIRKAIAKRGVMTKAYSAGKDTIAINMWNDVRQVGYDKKYNISSEDCEFLAEALVDAIKTICPKPMEAMDTLQNICGAILDEGREVKWVTPSGFPVTQVYNNGDQDEAKIVFNPPRFRNGLKARIGLKFLEWKDFPKRKKHASSISPNFVHSYDAAHLALVVAGINGPFGAVHDSFSVHACDIEELLHLTKTEFVKMYESDSFLEDVANSFEVSVDIPEVGNLDVQEIFNSDFFFA